MNHFAKAALCALALGAGIAGCSNDPTVITGGSTTNGSNIVFQQVDREGRPGIKELFLPYATHDAFNRITPMQDTTTSGAIGTFVSSAPAGRSAAIASYVSNILTPDALIANFNDTSQRASYLGYETNAGIAADCQGQAPTVFGGRALTDDVVNVMLGLTFGNLATTSNPTTPLVTATAHQRGRSLPTTARNRRAPAVRRISRIKWRPVRQRASRSARSRISQHPFNESAGAAPPIPYLWRSA